jgi:hypothetical protein
MTLARMEGSTFLISAAVWSFGFKTVCNIKVVLPNSACVIDF